MTEISTNGHRRIGLRAMLESLGGSLKDWTVMAPQRDPFRLDTPANHRDGQWLRETWDRLNIRKPLHIRGIHYALLGQPKPNSLECQHNDAGQRRQQ